MKLHFGHKITFLKSRLYVKSRFLKPRLNCIIQRLFQIRQRRRLSPTRVCLASIRRRPRGPFPEAEPPSTENPLRWPIPAAGLKVSSCWPTICLRCDWPRRRPRGGPCPRPRRRRLIKSSGRSICNSRMTWKGRKGSRARLYPSRQILNRRRRRLEKSETTIESTTISRKIFICVTSYSGLRLIQPRFIPQVALATFHEVQNSLVNI